MLRTIITIIVTTIVVLFSLQNFDHVPIYFFWGKPVSIRLVFVIAIAGVLGYMIRLFTSINREEQLKKQMQAMMRRDHKMRKKISEFEKEL